jgi:predicted O-methyltransferase YrrM
MNDQIAKHLDSYLDDLVPARPAELQKMEAHAREIGFPIIGPAAGQLCYLLARLAGARNIFEMGSGYGYSTAFFARAVKELGGGTVHHVVWDEALSQQARGHLETLGYGGLIEYHVSEAIQALRQSSESFDLIFCDIEKRDYPVALPVIEQRLRLGGLLIVDNMLRGGRIFDKDDHTADTEGVRELTRLLGSSPRWISSLIPIRDGLTIAQRI